MGLISDTLGKAIDVAGKFIPDAGQKMQMQLELERMGHEAEMTALQGDIDLAKGQIAVNQAEAGSTNLFVSGWRPFIGWVCGIGLVYALMARPLLIGFLKQDFPPLEMETLLTLLMGMLGLSGMRTFEKVRGVSK